MTIVFKLLDAYQGSFKNAESGVVCTRIEMIVWSVMAITIDYLAEPSGNHIRIPGTSKSGHTSGLQFDRTGP
jgi:hypothetical protein